MPKEGNVPQIRSSSLPATYRLLQFHLHWPSEHTINGYSFPLELHLVHANEDLPEDELYNNDQGLVVVAVIFEFLPSEIGKTLTTISVNT